MAMIKRINHMNEFQKEVLAYLNSIEDRLIRLEKMIAGSQRFAYAIAKSEFRRDSKQMFNVQRLVDAATAQTNATKAMKDAFDKVLADLRDAQDDPVQLEAALTAFEANTAVIAAAATAGTPADPGMPVPPVVEPPPVEPSTGM